MSKFKLNSTASKQAMAKATAKGGGSYKRFKMKGEQAALLLVGPVEEGEPVFGINVIHQHFGSDNSFICKAGSPEGFEQKDKLKEIGWKLKAKFDPKEGEGKPHPNKKIRELWRSFMPRKVYTINVIDLNDLEAGVQQYDAPMKVMEVIFDELQDCEDDLTSICHFNEGRRLLIKKSGKGFSTKYVAKFSTKTAALDLTPEEEDAFAAQVKPLSKIQEPLDEAAYAKVVDYLAGKAEKLGVNLDDLDDETDDDNTEVNDAGEEVEELVDDDAESEIVDTDDGEELEDDGFEEEPAPAPKPKAGFGNAQAKNAKPKTK